MSARITALFLAHKVAKTQHELKFVFSNILEWTGAKAPRWLYRDVTERNIPILAIGALLVAMFSAMLWICLVAGIPCPVSGFDEQAHRSAASLNRFTMTTGVSLIINVGIFAFLLLYREKKWNRPYLITIAMLIFSVTLPILMGVAKSGVNPDRQLLVFASMEFLIAGLLLFRPIVSLLYFVTFALMFAWMLGLYGEIDVSIVTDIVYLTVLNIAVSWIMYGLYARGKGHEHDVADQSRRDELTGAKNRHYLRDDFDSVIGVDAFVMFCDIDDFKRYNDCYNHSVGDQMLREFYGALHEAFSDECVYRYGGDEFLVISAEFGMEEFEIKARKIAEQIAHVEVDGENMGLTYSGGFVCGQVADGAVFRKMMRDADENLLMAKARGKHRIVGEGADIEFPGLPEALPNRAAAKSQSPQRVPESGQVPVIAASQE